MASREKALLDWKHSSLATKPLLFSTFSALSLLPTYTGHSNILGETMHYNDLEPKNKIDYENVPERLPMLTADQVTDNMEFDVIIVGSGAGGGNT